MQVICGKDRWDDGHSDKNRTKWRLRVPINEIPSILRLRYSWMTPFVPVYNPNSYDTVTTPLYSYDAAKVLDEDN